MLFKQDLSQPFRVTTTFVAKFCKEIILMQMTNKCVSKLESERTDFIHTENGLTSNEK